MNLLEDVIWSSSDNGVSKTFCSYFAQCWMTNFWSKWAPQNECSTPLLWDPLDPLQNVAFYELKKAVLKSALNKWGQIFIHGEDRYHDDLSLVVQNHAFQELKNAAYLGLKKAPLWGGVDGNFLVSISWTNSHNFSRIPDIMKMVIFPCVRWRFERV